MTVPLTSIILEEDAADTFPGLVLGLTSIFTTMWWIVLMFIHVRNHPSDNRLMSRAGEEVVPIAWFWERISEQTDIYVYLSIALMWGFVA